MLLPVNRFIGKQKHLLQIQGISGRFYPVLSEQSLA